MSYDNVIFDLQEFRARCRLYAQITGEKLPKTHFEFQSDLSDTENLSLLARYSLKASQKEFYLYAYYPIFLDTISRWITESSEAERLDVLYSITRILNVFSICQPLVELFMVRNKDYFTSLLHNPSTQTGDDLIKLLIAYYRLCYYKKHVFSKFIVAKDLHAMVEDNCTSLPLVIKYMAIKILGLHLGMNEISYNKMINTYFREDQSIEGPYMNDSVIDFRLLEVFEAKRFSTFSGLPLPNEHQMIVTASNDAFVIKSHNLSSDVVSVCGLLLPQVTTRRDPVRYISHIVPTSKTLTALREMAGHIQKNKPVMLLGELGSGKTFLIDELSKYMRCQDTSIKIHLGEQTDAKMLIGTYTSGEKPGTFEWRAGILATAVKEGRWVIIEDVDKAPTDVLSILLSLLEKRELSIPSRGEVIKAANGFQIIGTMRTSSESSSRGIRNSYTNLIGKRLWQYVKLESPSEVDLSEILLSKHRILDTFIPKLIKAFTNVRNIYADSRFISLNKGAHVRSLSSRDLIKLCTRLDHLFTIHGITSSIQSVELNVYDYVFAETTDCFTSSISEFKALEPLIYSIGEALEVSPSRIALFLEKHVPSIEKNSDNLIVGRAILPRDPFKFHHKTDDLSSFAFTNHSLRLMEQIGVAVQMTEAVLLVGETGTGKTTVVQELAKLVNKQLTVINLSQQTETSDLLGGYKPVNAKTVAINIQEDFDVLFGATFSLKKNEKFYKILHKCFNKAQWKNVIRLWNEAFKMAFDILKDDLANNAQQVKKRKIDVNQKTEIKKKWKNLSKRCDIFEKQFKNLDNNFVFNFVEGSLVKAIRDGQWLLLDEVNLASSDILESISDLLSEPATRNVMLSEKGETDPIKAHPDFRLFACMNPATDVGKRDLAAGIRSRFTEIYVHSPERDISDLLSIIDKYIGKFSVSDEWIGNDIANLYIDTKKLADANKIVDGSNQKPHFSIRTLTRTLLYVTDIVSIYGLRRALYDGFCMSFLTLLNQSSSEILVPVIEKYTIGRLKNAKSVMSTIPNSPGSQYIQFKHYWLKKGSKEATEQPHYIITPFVEKNMLNLVRATSGNRFPILVQGPTSAGKTSMIKYLADITGHHFVRINNHEHTDLQEYLGTYTTDENGRLTFQEGILVEALRKGYWIVLDELNLAPTDVLEALNRLLDDNRELFIPETQQIIHPHPDFMLFATQNPPGLYGGRKLLSRAFRNRFLELHFDEIPQDELEIILRERCQIAPSYANKIVETYRQLSIERAASRVFEQKNSFATLRDLFRWAQRGAVGYEELAAHGFMLLGERCRNDQEKHIVKNVIEKVMKVKLDIEQFYHKLEDPKLLENKSVIWTRSMRRLAVLVLGCIKNNEPVLLVGETGCGKTTICQIISEYLKKPLITLNAHQNTETSDILGAQRPNRSRSAIQQRLQDILLHNLTITKANTTLPLQDLIEIYANTDKKNWDTVVVQEIEELREKLNILFEWNDGPLVQALQEGSLFLLDEISLADDSVLERFNSLLEPERSLLLAEKGSTDNLIIAQQGFQFFATMNPGGDYGKKELSPALRNRFTEIWVPSMECFEDIHLIATSTLYDAVKPLAKPITRFSEWFARKLGGGVTNSGIISLRDIVGWIEFINETSTKIDTHEYLLLEGALMVFIDALGTNSTAYLAENPKELASLKSICIEKLEELSEYSYKKYIENPLQLQVTGENIKVGLFSLRKQKSGYGSCTFNWRSPTTIANLMRVTRALQVRKPILLEGSPGVGKTSLVTALASLTGNELTRINLSEQTDLIDLFGSDVPGEKAGEFQWRDAPFLQAMKAGHWVLLDEMNLASQSVLEGLNACLDHRGEVFIPELDRSFRRHPDFVVFAAQNPQYQGGGRKGLPKSYINRFTVVYVDTLKFDDLISIAQHLHPTIPTDLITKLVKLVSELERQVVKRKLWGIEGSPWEFNLRDTLRWLQLLESQPVFGPRHVQDFVDIIIKQRFRTDSDRQQSQKLIESIFGPSVPHENYFKLTPGLVQVNNEVIRRSQNFRYQPDEPLIPLQCNFNVYESAIRCIKNNWPLILVGPSNAGKTNIVNYLASIIGQKVSIFHMNNDIDSMDILGGYEQVDNRRKISDLIQDVMGYLSDVLSANLSRKDGNAKAIQYSLNLIDIYSEAPITPSTFDEFETNFNLIIPFLPKGEVLDILLSRIADTKLLLKQVEEVRFEWFDGMLVRAVEKGYWLILDNANLCSASVLDRLNSLLEFNGTLLMNECSEEDGSPRVLKAHPNFRLFMTVDPKYGELSRAMRNRGIEIFVDDLHTRMTKMDKQSLESNISFSIESVLSNLNITSSGISRSQKPMNYYLPSWMSSFVDMSQISDSIMIHQTPMSIDSLASLVSVDKQSQLRTFIKYLKNDNSHELKNKLISVQEFLAYLGEMGIVDYIEDFYSRLCYEFEGCHWLLVNKPLLPFLNMALLQSIKQPGFEDSTGTIYSYNMLCLLHSLRLKLGKIRESCLVSKIDQLSYVELSAAQTLGRHIKNPPRIKLYDFLTKLSNYMDMTVSANFSFEHSEIYKCLRYAMVIMICLLETAENREEARIRVYSDILMEWYELFKNSVGPNFEKILEYILEFQKNLTLSRGYSITLLWEAFRGVYPSTSQNWSEMTQIMNLADRFDKVAVLQFSDSYELIQQLRGLIIEIQRMVLDNSRSDLSRSIVDIENGIQRLEDVTNKFLNARLNIFKSEFDTLSHFIYLPKNSILAKILPMTSISTNQFSKLEQLISPPYPLIFDVLWFKSDGKFVSSVSGMFNSALFEGIFEKASSLRSYPAYQLNQTISDSKSLMKATVQASMEILSDQTIEYSSILSKWIRAVIEIHCKDQSLPDYITTVDDLDISDPGVRGVLERYIIPAQRLLSVNDDGLSLGKAWVLFGIGMLILFVPNLPVDPAIHEYANLDIFSKYRELTEQMVSSWSTIREVISGDQQISLKKHYEASFEMKLPKKPKVYRPTGSVDLVFDEWNSFVDSTLDIKQIDSLLSNMENPSDNTFSRLELFQQTSSQFLENLKKGYPNFADLNDIFEGFLLAMKFGFDILRNKAHQSSRSIIISSLWPVNPLVVTNISDITSIFRELETFISTCDIDSAVPEMLSVFITRVYNLHKKPVGLLDTFNRQLFFTYKRWHMRNLKTEREKELNSTIFKYEDKNDDYEAEIAELFPSYDDEINPPKINENSVTISLEDVMESLALQYIKLFSDEEEFVQDVMEFGAEIFHMMNETGKFKSDKLNGAVLTSVIQKLSTASEFFNKETDHLNFNFYKDSSPLEFKRSIVIVDKILISSSNLLNEWPTHATLRDIFRVCKEYMNFSLHTPMAKQIQKLEQIYTFLVDWQKYASSKVSVEHLIKELTNLLVSWRRLELHTWKGLFKAEENTASRTLGKWWFHLYDILISRVVEQRFDEDMNALNLASSLNVFFCNSTVGDFQQKLKMTEAFNKHLELMGLSDSSESKLLRNMVKFYSQYLSSAKSFIENKKKALEKEINDVILLASWKDVNIEALKQSSRRSHNNLFKVIRKYREILSTEISTFVETGLDANPKLDFFPTVLSVSPSTYRIEVFDQELKKIQSWNSRPKLLADIETIASRIQKLHDKIEHQAFPSLLDIAKQYNSEADNLRSETPKVYDKKVKKVIANLKQQKAMLLSDALKELKRSGLRTGYRQDYHELQSSTTAILAKMQPFDNKFIHKYDDFFFKILDIFPRLKSATASPVNDVPITAIEKAMAMAENLMFLMITSRNYVSQVADTYSAITTRITELKSMCDSKGSIQYMSLNHEYESMRNAISWLPKLLSYCRSTLRAIPDLDVSESMAVLSTVERDITTIAVGFCDSSVLDDGMAARLKDFKCVLQKIVEYGNSQNKKPIGFVFRTLLLWINQFSVAKQSTAENCEINIDKIEATFRKALVSVMLATQNLTNCGLESFTTEDDGWLTSTFQSLKDEMRIVNLSPLIKNLDLVLEIVKLTDVSVIESNSIRALAAFTLPALNNYNLVVASLLNKARNHYKDTCEASYKLFRILISLAKDGFCSPEPPSEEIQDDNLHDGTGLGDAEGAQNNSKDIEQDEDLTEDAQKSNPDQKENDPNDDEADDAVEMEGDMAGDLEDLYNSEKEEDEDIEDEDELDEEIDQIGEDDPNEIDEKMWNDEDDQEMKEKNTNQQLDDGKENEDLQASESNENKNDISQNGDTGNPEPETEQSKENADDQDSAQENESQEDDNGQDTEEEGVGEQEDKVDHKEGGEMENDVPDVETMNLPDDLNLDEEENISEADSSNEEKYDSDIEDAFKDSGMDENESSVASDVEHEDNENKDASDDATEDKIEGNVSMPDQSSEKEEELTDEIKLEADAELEDLDKNPDAGKDNLDSKFDDMDAAENDLEDGENEIEGAVEQKSGSKGTGSNVKEEEEQSEIGNFGDAKDQQKDDHDDLDSSNVDKSRKEAKETLKQLGDSLKEYHRRRQDINDASDEVRDDEAPAEVNERPDEFEHIDGANDNFSTQALGSANQEQKQSVEDEMAIDDEEDSPASDDRVEDKLEKEAAEETQDQDNANMDTTKTNEDESFEDIDHENAKLVSNEIEQQHDLVLDESKNSAMDFSKYEDDLDRIMDVIDQETKVFEENETPARTINEARDIWQNSSLATMELASRLSEQLRLILEPTMATKLKGDYKTGKRLNMKRIIPYIASQFRKDKIWLRRTKPSKRQYQIMIAIDNSKSMSESRCSRLAFDSLCLVSKTLSQLESGDLSIIKFGEHTREVHKFDEQFTGESGPKAFQWFSFNEIKTDVTRLVGESIIIFEEARARSGNDDWQLEIVISDGLCEDHDTVERLVRRAKNQKIMLIFVIIDGLGNSKESIMDMNQVQYVPDANGTMKLHINKYLNTFPFEFYLIIHDITELPEMLSTILRQYFADIASS